MIGLLEVGALSLTLLAVVSWPFIVSFSRRHVERCESRCLSDSVATRALLYAPIWVPALLLLAAMSPGLLGLVFSVADHCGTPGAGHYHHLCLVHPPHALQQASLWLGPAALLGVVGLRLYPAIVAALRERFLVRSLVRTSRPSALGSNIRLLDQDEPVAVTVGWFAPRVLVSTGLVGQVSKETLEVVLAHEACHVQRRDTLRALCDGLLARMLPGTVATGLLACLALRRERACDESAARVVGGRVRVARALTEVARLKLDTGANNMGVSICSSSLETRVVHLLSPYEPRESKTSRSLLLVMSALLILGAFPVHASIERFITFVFH